MATDVIKTLTPSGGDYTSMTAWLSARGGDIVTRDTNEIAEFETFSGGLSDNSYFGGCVTDSTHKFILRVAAGHEHGGLLTGGFYFSNTGNITIRPISTCEDIELIGIAHTGRTLFSATANGGGDNIILDKCIIANSSATALDIPIGGFAQNCLIYNAGGDGIVNLGTVTGCTVYGSANRGLVTNFGDVSNCISVNNTGVDFSYQSGTHDFNLSEDATANDTNSLNNRTIKNAADLPLAPGDNVIFNDTTADDYSMVDDAENDAIAAGVTISGFTEDIIGTTRGTPPGMGAFEIVSGGPTGQTITPAIIASVRSVPSPTLSKQASKAIAPVTVSGNRVIPAPTVMIQGSDSISTALIVRSRNIPIPAVTAQINKQIIAVSIDPTRTIPSPTITKQSSQVIEPTPIVASRTIPPPTLSTGGGQTITLPSIVRTRTIPSPTLGKQASQIIVPVTVSGNRVIPAPTIMIQGSDSISTALIVRSRNIPIPAVTVQVNKQIIATFIQPTRTIPSPTLFLQGQTIVDTSNVTLSSSTKTFMLFSNTKSISLENITPIITIT